MSISPLSGNLLQQLALQQSLGIQTPGNNVNGAGADSNQLSSLGKLLSTLQQLQESNPAQFKQLAQQIATNLQTAAQTAKQQGNNPLASQLNQLATDFTNAAQSGQLPAASDLAQALGGGHHHHHHAAPLNPLNIIESTVAANAPTASTTSSTTASTAAAT